MAYSQDHRNGIQDDKESAGSNHDGVPTRVVEEMIELRRKLDVCLEKLEDERRHKEELKAEVADLNDTLLICYNFPTDEKRANEIKRLQKELTKVKEISIKELSRVQKKCRIHEEQPKKGFTMARKNSCPSLDFPTTPQHILDEIESYRTQAALYKEDFEREREERAAKVGEVDDLKRKIQVLEQKNLVLTQQNAVLHSPVYQQTYAQLPTSPRRHSDTPDEKTQIPENVEPIYDSIS